jgi:hypothetical protein
MTSRVIKDGTLVFQSVIQKIISLIRLMHEGMLYLRIRTMSESTLQYGEPWTHSTVLETEEDENSRAVVGAIMLRALPMSQVMNNRGLGLVCSSTQRHTLVVQAVQLHPAPRACSLPFQMDSRTLRDT